MKSGAVELTSPNANSDPANTQKNYNSYSIPASHQSAPANPPPPYDFPGQPLTQYSGPQSGAPASFPGGQQSAASPYPQSGYVYGSSGTTGYIQAGYVAPSSGNQPVVCTTGGYVVQPTTIVVAQQYQQVDKYCGYIAFAIFVFMCCCPIIGFIAAAFAGTAQSKAAIDRSGARRMIRVSLALSISGLIIGVIIIIIVVSMICSNYRIGGRCFRYRERSRSFDCSFDHLGSYYKDGNCYWN